MMPALHNYMTVDPDKFIANPRNMEMIYDMCKTVSNWYALISVEAELW